MASTGSIVLVDDTNPRVQYVADWIWDQSVVEVDGTRHGAGKAGLTAQLSFTGTGVQVVGTLGPSSDYGQPTTTYSIDGHVMGSYAAPFTPGKSSQYNVTFFTASNLYPGDHEVLINNTDGTSPNVFWLDYFLINALPSSDSNSPPPPSTTTSTQSTPSPSSTTSQPLVSSSTVVFSPTQSPSVQTTESQPTSTHSSFTHSSLISTSSQSSSPLATTHTTTDVTTGPSNTAPSTVTVSLAAAPSNDSTGSLSTWQEPTGKPSTSRSTTRLNHGVLFGTLSAGFVALIAIAGLLLCVLRRRRRRAHQELPIVSSSEQLVSGMDATLDYGEYKPAAQTGASSVEEVSSQPPPSIEHAPSTVLSAPGPTGDTYHADRTPFPTEPPGELFSTADLGPPASPAGVAPNPSTALTAVVHAATSEPDGLPFPRGGVVAPPGLWHAPPSIHSRAVALLQSVFVPVNPTPSIDGDAPAHQDVDSGLRLYHHALLPPPYTQD